MTQNLNFLFTSMSARVLLGGILARLAQEFSQPPPLYLRGFFLNITLNLHKNSASLHPSPITFVHAEHTHHRLQIPPLPPTHTHKHTQTLTQVDLNTCKFALPAQCTSFTLTLSETYYSINISSVCQKQAKISA